jgi:hypothetical protein
MDINLQSNNLTNIDTMLNYKKLMILNLINNPITNLKKEYIAKLKKVTNIKELYLQSEYFTDKFISYETDYFTDGEHSAVIYPYCSCCKHNYADDTYNF